jgi:hypothetical protein
MDNEQAILAEMNEAVQAEKSKEVKETAPVEKNEAEESHEGEAREHDAKEATQSEYSEIELQAMEHGWKPKEQYGKDDWRPAKEFMDRHELFTKIHRLNRDNKSLQTSMKQMHEMLKKSSEVTRKKVLEELNQQKREAIEQGDVIKVETLEEEIYKETKEIEKEKEQEKLGAQSKMPEEVLEWVAKNKSWFNNQSIENSEMRDEAVKAENWIRQNHPELDHSETFRMVETHIRKKYPHRFDNPNKHRAQAVENSSNRAGSKKTERIEEGNIPAEYKQIAHEMVRNGLYKTTREYFQDLKQMGYIE